MNRARIIVWVMAAMGSLAVGLLAYAPPPLGSPLMIPAYLVLLTAIVYSLDLPRLFVGMHSRAASSVLLGFVFVFGIFVGDYGWIVSYGGQSLSRAYYSLAPTHMGFVPQVLFLTAPSLPVFMSALAAGFFSIKSALEPRFRLSSHEGENLEGRPWSIAFQPRSLRRMGLRLSLRLAFESLAALVGRSRAGVPGLAIGSTVGLFVCVVFYMGALSVSLLRGFGAMFGYFENASVFANASTFVVFVLLLTLVMANRASATEGIRALVHRPLGVLGLGVSFAVLSIALGVPSVFAPPARCLEWTPLARYAQVAYFISCPLLAITLSRLTPAWAHRDRVFSRWDLVALVTLVLMYLPHALDKLFARPNPTTGLAQGIRVEGLPLLLFDIWTSVMLTAYIGLSLAAVIARTRESHRADCSSLFVRWAVVGLLLASGIASSSVWAATFDRVASALLFVAILGVASSFLSAIGGNLEAGGTPIAFRRALGGVKRAWLGVAACAAVVVALIVVGTYGRWAYQNAVTRIVLMGSTVGSLAAVGAIATYALWSMRFVSEASLRKMGQAPQWSDGMKRLRELRLERD